MMIKRVIVLGALFFFSVLYAAETVPLKATKTKAIIAAGIVTELSEDVNLMPGNDDFGFFYKDTGNKKGICRIRIKAVCEFSFGIEKEVKNEEVNFQFKDGTIKKRTDIEGLVDILFRCEEWRKNDGVIISAKKHIHSSKLSETPKILKIPEADCK